MLYNNQHFSFNFLLYSIILPPRIISFRLSKVSIHSGSPSFFSIQYSLYLRIIRAINCKRTISHGREMGGHLPRLSKRRLRESRYVRGASVHGTENQTFAIVLSNWFYKRVYYLRGAKLLEPDQSHRICLFVFRLFYKLADFILFVSNCKKCFDIKLNTHFTGKIKQVIILYI